MKVELQDKLVEVIGAVQAAAAKTTDFAVEQLPDIAQQYIAFGRVGETVYLILFILVAIGGYHFTCRMVRGVSECKGDETVYAFGVALGGVVTLFCSIFAALTIQSFIMVWFAPKIYLLKGLAGLLK